MGWGNLIVFDGKLIILRETGELVIAAATPESYLEHSRADVIDGRSWTVPALTDGRLYCRNNTGQVVCLQLLGAAGKMQPVSQAGPTPPISHPSGTMPEGLTQIAPTKTSSADRAVTQTAPSRWPRFRGPGGLGLAPFDGVPTVWNTQTGEGIVWKTALPLAGQSSPVLWDKRIFLSGASKTKRQVYCLDTNTGKLLWQTTINTSSNSLGDQAEDTASVLLAASTPVADGRHVYALYGNGDLACLDFDGQVVWTRSFGKPDNMYGYAASLERWRNLLLVQLDQASAKDRLSKLAALDVSSGRTVWEVPRPVPSSWSSPIVINTVGAEQIITAGDPWVIAYEPATAAEIWRANCLGGEVVPSPIFANGLVLAVSVDGKFAAIRPDGKGDITQTHVAWSEEEHLPPICSPVSHDELVFLLDTGGLLACLDVRNGKLVWEHDLGTSFQASPSVVKGLLYLISDQGVAFIIKANRKYELVAANPLGEECQASPAFQPGRIYVRGKHHLFAIGQAGK
jgi:outer membrane protein assembly factor BamB